MIKVKQNKEVQLEKLVDLQGLTIQRETLTQLMLLESCVSRLNDIILITEAEPFLEPGPRIVYVNDAFERRTGYKREEVLGKSPRILQGPNTQREELNRIGAAMQNWQPVRAELINYTKTGEEFWIELDIAPVKDETGCYTYWISVERDITERKLAELEMQRLNRALTLIGTCIEVLLKTKNEKQLLDEICRLAVEIGAYKMAWVGYAEDDPAQSIIPVAHFGDFSHLEDIKLSWSADTSLGMGPAGKTIRSGKATIIEDFSEDDDFAPWAESAIKNGLSGVVCLPLINNGLAFGLLGLYSGEIRHLPDGELKLLLEMASNLAFGIDTLRKDIEQQRLQSAVFKVATSVTAVVNESFLQQLTLNMIEALNADVGGISLYQPENPLIAKTLSAVVAGQVIDNFEYSIIGSPCEKTINSKEVFFVARNLSDSYQLPTLIAELKPQAYVGKLLTSTNGKPLGILFVMYLKAQKEIDFILSTFKILAARFAAELQRLETDENLREKASLLDKAQDAIIVRSIDKGIVYWNKSAERLYGWKSEEVIGKSIDHVLYHDDQYVKELTRKVLEKGEWKGELEHLTKQGKTIHVETHLTLVRDEDGQPKSILAINTDIRNRKEVDHKIQKLAFYDALTGLPNRQLLMDRLTRSLALSQRNKNLGALLFIDLDNFKLLNDSQGHHMGDLLLQEVAKRISICVRETDTVARFGGDEFVVMLDDLSSDRIEAAKQAGIIVNKILLSFSQVFELQNSHHYSTPSIGLTLFGVDLVDIEEILKRSDLAMYEAKASGKNTVRFFDPEMQAVISSRLTMEENLRLALNKQQMFLVFQPQVDRLGSIVGAEVLLRWKHPEYGLISPLNFIPVAEDTGLILPIGLWVLKTACMQLALWAKSTNKKHINLSVNVSARQFHQHDFIDIVLQTIKETGANPSMLKLELTESLLVANVEDTINKMITLKNHGISFSLDDFGTGYSSLSYLKRLPIDQLKIDQSFVRDILVDSNDAAIAKTIIALGQTLGLNVIAEGVEEVEQKAFLFENGCYYYQGYLFSKPILVEQFEALIV